MAALNTLDKGCTVGNKYRLINKIGTGSFSVVYVGKDIETNEEVAVKLERRGGRYPQLHYESKVYEQLKGGHGILQPKWYGHDHGYNVLVMDLLGPNLEDLFNFCSRRFTMKTVLVLADQMIACLEVLHNRGFIHRDIAPTNFLMGLREESSKVYLVDFGMAKKYFSKRTGEHAVYRKDKSLTGTPRYASIKNHLGRELSRRDDMESIGYILLYLVRGKLPWQGLKASGKKEKNERICEKKMSMSIEDLCKGIPTEFARYLQYCRRRRYEDEPKYAYLREIFKPLLASQTVAGDQLLDLEFFWTDRSKHQNQQQQETSDDESKVLKELPTNRCLPGG